MAEANFLSSSKSVRGIVDAERLNELGPGRPLESEHAQLQELTPARLLAPRPVKNRPLAEACLAGLWLWCDFLDESHRISQDLATAEGSYWHAILHRREPDYDNAKYWFRRVGEHPVYVSLVSEARQLAATSGTDTQTGRCLLTQTSWDPFRFVDQCQAAAADNVADNRLCRLVQRLEWMLLFQYCYQHAGE